MNALLLLGFMFFFILLETPFFVAVGLSGLVYILIVHGPANLVMIPFNMVNGLDNFALLAIPFYMFAGEAMNQGGLTQRIVGFTSSIFGYLRGGLNYVNITANVIMAGISGSAVADCAATGAVLIPAMEKEGYGKTFAGAITAAASTMGPIIPPSIPMIIFGLLSGTSIADLFIGGVIPGFMMAGFLFVSCYFIAIRRNHPKREGRVSAREIWATFRKAFLALMLPFIVLGGIFTGIMTVTEAGAVALVYALFAGIFVYRELSWRAVPKLFFHTAYNASILLIALATVQILSHLMAEMQLSTLLAGEIMKITQNKYMILLIINVFLLLVGCVMDPLTSLLLLVPILLPVVQKVGVNPVHFGVVMVLNLMIGLSTPPVGGLLFITSIMAKIPMADLVKELLPFILIFIGILFLITYVPSLVLFLPGLLK